MGALGREPGGSTCSCVKVSLFPRLWLLHLSCDAPHSIDYQVGVHPSWSESVTTASRDVLVLCSHLSSISHWILLCYTWKWPLPLVQHLYSTLYSMPGSSSMGQSTWDWVSCLYLRKIGYADESNLIIQITAQCLIFFCLYFNMVDVFIFHSCKKLTHCWFV